MRRVYEAIDRACDKIFWFIMKVLLAGALDVLLVGAILYVYVYQISDYGN